MKKFFRSLWHDPVGSKVISGIILAGGSAFAVYWLNWWPTIRTWGGNIVSFFAASTAIPNWLFFFVLCPLVLIGVLITVVFLRDCFFPPQPASPTWENYTTDLFFGVRWRWRYSETRKIYDLCTFCPHCDFQVYARNVSAYEVIPHIAFQCESCGRRLGDFPESLDSLENKTRRFIQQKLRNDSWRNSESNEANENG